MSLSEFENLFTQAQLAHFRAEAQKNLTSHEKVLENKLQSAHKLIEKAEKSARIASSFSRVIPDNYHVSNFSAVGSYRVIELIGDVAGQFATFDFKLDFEVFKKSWTSLPLLHGDQICSSKWHVSLNETRIAMGRGYMLRRGTNHSLSFLTRIPGRYTIEYQCHVRVQNTLGKLLGMRLRTKHPLTAVRLDLTTDTINAGRLVNEVDVRPNARWQLVRDIDEIDPSSESNAETKKSNKQTQWSIMATLAPTTEIEMRFRIASPSEKAQRTADTNDKTGSNRSNRTETKQEIPQPQPPQMTVVHDALHTVGEGLLRSINYFTYQMDAITDTQISSLDIFFTHPSALRITSVDSADILDWTPISFDEQNRTGIRIRYTSSLITDAVQVVVHTEVEVDTQGSGKVAIPVARCPHTIRQTGSFGVAKEASVELHMDTTRGLARTDVGELASQVQHLSSSPIIFAFKYLSAEWVAQLSVLHHAAIAVDATIVETALYEVLITDTDAMHKVTATLAHGNTRQYLNVRLPPNATISQLRVNSRAAKPVRKSKALPGELLVPLQFQLSGSGAEGSASVEIVFLTSHPELRENGTLHVHPPSFDMLMSTLGVTLLFPDNYDANYTTAMNAVSHSKANFPRPKVYDGNTGKLLVRYGEKTGRGRRQTSSASRATSMDIPQSGTARSFKKLLVRGKAPFIRVDYWVPSQEEDGEQPQQSRFWSVLSAMGTLVNY